MTELRTITIAWQQGHDEHTWSARLGDVYRLRVIPVIGGMYTIRYSAQLLNMSAKELAVEADLHSVEHAKQRAVYLAWQHNYALGDALLSLI